MAWTDERIDTLKTMWEQGSTASQIAEALGGVSRNAVIGKAHRLGLQSRPSPVRPNEPDKAKRAAAPEAAVPAPPTPPEPAMNHLPIEPAVFTAPEPEPEPEPELEPEADAAPAGLPASTVQPAADAEPEPRVVLRSVGPGGFVRQTPGEQQPPATPAPPRRLVPARPSADVAGKTTLLDLNDRICKWPIGHPGEPDFHFCGDAVNPGFPYCVAHCGHAYQAQLPRRDRRPSPMPFGGPRAR